MNTQVHDFSNESAEFGEHRMLAADLDKQAAETRWPRGVRLAIMLGGSLAIWSMIAVLARAV